MVFICTNLPFNGMSNMGELGALGSWGAAMLSPYSDKPDLQGTLLQAPEVLRAAVRRYWEDDMQVVCPRFRFCCAQSNLTLVTECPLYRR